MYKNKIGFMQGRLSDLVNNLIQAFPVDNWRQEFIEAKKLELKLMEWTLDFKDLYKNPLMTMEGRKEINFLMQKYSVLIPSITADCLKQRPFWKSSELEIANLQKIFLDVVESASELGSKYIIVPLVDKGSIENEKQEHLLINFLLDKASHFENLNVEIIFESDFEPKQQGSFIRKLPVKSFGINYDTGDSASLGFDTNEEFFHFGEFIKNVHIKDRKKNGTTIPLQEGDVNFKQVFSNLKKFSYKGNFILQPARDKNNNHSKTISISRDFTLDCIDKYL